jgi:hypothetical protein
MVNKKRLYQTAAPYPTSIAALAFSPDGQMLAVAASYTFEKVARVLLDISVIICNSVTG